MADPRPTNTGFDPQFGDPLKRWRDYLESQGIQTNIISGVRSEQEHQMAWENFLAGQQGRPLPYPEFGPVSRATPPGQTSTHDVGLGADVQPVNRADLPKMYASAAQFGIQPLGKSDPYHFQLGNWRQAEATQARPTPWTQVADIPSSYAMNAEANAPSQPGRPVSATPIPGGTSHADFIRSYARSIGLDPDLALGIANAEGLRAWSAKNPNAASSVDVQSGQPFSFGDFQLNIRNGLGNTALAKGIDPRDPNQWQAADKFAMDQMKAGGVAPWKGDPVAKQYLATGKVQPAPTMPGTTLNSAPTAGADGATAPGAPTAAFGSAGNLPGFQPNSAAAKMTSAGLDQLKKGMGIGDSEGGDEKPPAMAPLPTPPPAMPAGGPMMLGSGGMNTFGQRAAEQQLGQQGFMTQPTMAAFNTAPPLLPTPAAAMPGGMTGVTGLPGTTLNSPSQLQTAMLYGSLDPFDPYGRYGNAASNYGSA